MADSIVLAESVGTGKYNVWSSLAFYNQECGMVTLTEVGGCLLSVGEASVTRGPTHFILGATITHGKLRFCKADTTSRLR